MISSLEILHKLQVKPPMTAGARRSRPVAPGSSSVRQINPPKFFFAIKGASTQTHAQFQQFPKPVMTDGGQSTMRSKARLGRMPGHESRSQRSSYQRKKYVSHVTSREISTTEKITGCPARDFFDAPSLNPDVAHPQSCPRRVAGGVRIRRERAANLGIFWIGQDIKMARAGVPHE